MVFLKLGKWFEARESFGVAQFPEEPGERKKPVYIYSYMKVRKAGKCGKTMERTEGGGRAITFPCKWGVGGCATAVNVSQR